MSICLEISGRVKGIRSNVLTYQVAIFLNLLILIHELCLFQDVELVMMLDLADRQQIITWEVE